MFLLVSLLSIIFTLQLETMDSEPIVDSQMCSRKKPVSYSALGELPKTADGAIALYDSWAKTYDAALISWGYPGPRRVAETIRGYVVDTNTKLIDLGCGTGLSGEALASFGFSTIDGVDISQKSLDVISKSKHGVYNQLFQGSLDEPMSFLEDKTYDGAISVGVFSYVENFESLFSEIVRICRPSSIVAFTHRTELWDSDHRNCVSAAKALEASGKWRIEHVGSPEAYMPHNPDPAESEKTIRILVYRCL